MTLTSHGSRSDPAARLAVRAAGLGLLLVLVAGAGLAAAEPHPDLREFLPSGTYILQVDGKKLSSAEVWRLDSKHNAENMGKMNISSGELALPAQSISLYLISKNGK